MEGKCCVNPGSNSLTMIRHPFIRGVSGFFYRGHNPNFDFYNLRPGAWLPPSQQKRGEKFSFSDFTLAAEYRNVLTKMFGASKFCDQVSSCNQVATTSRMKGGPCLLVTGCHAYRNVTFLNETHLDIGVRALSLHRFVGLVEAYNSSVLLLATKFGLDLNELSFAPQRVNFKSTCHNLARRKVQANLQLCKDYMRANELDARLYESMHRKFCQELREQGLWYDPMVVQDLEKLHLCGDVDFSNPDHFCPLLSSEEVWKKINEDDDMCEELQREKVAGRQAERRATTEAAKRDTSLPSTTSELPKAPADSPLPREETAAGKPATTSTFAATAEAKAIKVKDPDGVFLGNLGTVYS